MKDEMKIGYIRISKAGPNRKEQESALRTVGIEDFSVAGAVYVDDPEKTKNKMTQLPSREAAIASLRAGDEFVVASAGRLGTSADDVLEALKAITENGAAVYDVAVGERIVFDQAVIVALAFMERARQEERKNILAKARAEKAALGAHRGPPIKLTGRAKEDAREAWEDMTLTASDVVKRSGVSESTLRRLFGPKGTPRFGRSDKASEK